MLLIFISFFLSCSRTSDEKYSLSLDGKIVIKDVSYEELQNHLRQYSEYDYQVYSESIGEWKPWKEVMNSTHQRRQKSSVGSKTNMVSGPCSGENILFRWRNRQVLYEDFESSR